MSFGEKCPSQEEGGDHTGTACREDGGVQTDNFQMGSRGFTWMKIPHDTALGVSKGYPFGTRLCLQSVVCYTLCRRCCENEVAAGEGKGI